jgi:hypothetical protein
MCPCWRGSYYFNPIILKIVLKFSASLSSTNIMESRESEKISVFKNKLKNYSIEMQNENVCKNVASNNIRLFSKM